MCLSGISKMENSKATSVKVANFKAKQLKKKEEKNAAGGETPRQIRGILKTGPKGKINNNKRTKKC